MSNLFSSDEDDEVPGLDPLDALFSFKEPPRESENNKTESPRDSASILSSETKKTDESANSDKHEPLYGGGEEEEYRSSKAATGTDDETRRADTGGTKDAGSVGGENVKKTDEDRNEKKTDEDAKVKENEKADSDDVEPVSGLLIPKTERPWFLHGFHSHAVPPVPPQQAFFDEAGNYFEHMEDFIARNAHLR
jgi:hypothetical protein